MNEKPRTAEQTARLYAIRDELLAPVSSAKPCSPQVAGKRLARGRTNKKVEEVTQELNAARSKVAALERHIGDVFNADSDTTAASNDLKTAEDRVRLLEMALATAMEKDRAALAELKAAEHVDTLAAEQDTLTRLKQAGFTFEKMLSDFEEFLNNQLVPAMDACRGTAGHGYQATFLSDAAQSVELYLLKAARRFSPRGRAVAAMLGAKTFSERLPDAGYAGERRTFK